MSILIKDMDMPKGCEQCCFSGYTKCKLMPIGFDEYPLVGKRPDWCPLIEVETVDQEELIMPLNMIGGYLRKVTTEG